MATLFDEPKPMSARLAALAERGVFIGTSSWKYEGWLGSIYTPERYYTRGKFSQKKFEETCLEEYAETFPIVCGDFSFYQFPSDAFWRKLFGGSPSKLRFAFKVPEEITVKKWPTHARYGARAGLENENFLSSEVFTRMFYEPLALYGDRVALFIFEFGAFSKSAFPDVHAFTDMLDGFLSALPEGPRYSVEIRNAEYLSPTYFDVLRSNGVAHVFNAWTRMPDLPAQVEMAEAYTAEFVVSRALLRQGRTFEEGVRTFAPYTEVKEPLLDTRKALRKLIQEQVVIRNGVYLFVNNRLEGNAPGTIQAVVESLEI